MSENPSQYGPADPTQRVDPAAPSASPAPPTAPTSGQPGAASPYADPTQQMYPSEPGAPATPPTYTAPPSPEYGATPGYYGPGATPGGTPGAVQPGAVQPGQEAWGQQQQPGYPTSGGAGYEYQQPGYAQPAQYPQGPYPPQAGYPTPYPPQAMYDAQGRPLSDKSKLAAGLLSIFLGSFGVGRFYTGHVGLGIGQIAVTLVTCFTLGWVWGLIDGILILVNGGTDAQGRVLRE